MRRSLQDSLDSATLAAARSSARTPEAVRAVGMAALRANLAAFPRVVLNEDPERTSFVMGNNGTVTGFAHAGVDTLVAGSFLGHDIDVGANSQVSRAMQRIEVALVIDTTSSMRNNGKIEAARAAAVQMVRELQAAAQASGQADAVRISLVPFAANVRVLPGFGATTNRTQAAAYSSWLSSNAAISGPSGPYRLFSTDTNRFALYDALQTGWGGCIEMRPQPYDIQDTPASSSVPATMFVPFFHPDRPDPEHFSVAPWGSWTGAGYGNQYLTENAPWTATYLNGVTDTTVRRTMLSDAWLRLEEDASKYTMARLRSDRPAADGPNKFCNQDPVVRLTDDFDSLVDSIEALTPRGDTNTLLGLMWGWHTLSPNTPFQDGAPYSDNDTRKVIILLSDGGNSNVNVASPDGSIYTGMGFARMGRLGLPAGSTGAERGAAMDARMLQLCTNLRNRDISLFTIGVMVPAADQAHLDACATEPNMSFPVSDASELGPVFEAITGRIRNLRISR